MRALTVCQPYAHLLALPEEHPEAKPIENRTWWTSYRGPLLIHAGKSREWLRPGDIADWPDMVFGAVVALVDLKDCVSLAKLPDRLRGHKHANGPFCLLTGNVRRLPQPIPWIGAQGLWDVGPALERQVREQLEVRPHQEIRP
jgi:hypothetical protein